MVWYKNQLIGSCGHSSLNLTKVGGKPETEKARVGLKCVERCGDRDIDKSREVVGDLQIDNRYRYAER